MEEILDSFENWELAYFKKYMLDTYLEETQIRIEEYVLNKRGLDAEQMEKLMAENSKKYYPDLIKRCPRCKSDKIRSDKTEWIIPLFNAGAEDELAMLQEIHTGETYYKDQTTCGVCGFVIEDPNNEKRPFYDRIIDFILDNPIWSIYKGHL